MQIKMETHPEIIEVAKTLNRMEEATFQCPICADRFKHPVRLRCEHTFCKMCIERHIRTSHNYNEENNKSRCPICQDGPITKRNLQPDTELTPLMDLFQGLLDDLEEAVGVDFKAVRIPQEHAGREAPGDTPITAQKKLNTRTQSRPRSTNSSGGPSRTPRLSKNGPFASTSSTMLFKEPTPTSKNENINTVKTNDISGVSEVVTESNSSGCAPVRENLVEKVTETRDGNNQPSDFDKGGLSATKKANSKKKPVKSNEEVASNKNNSNGDDKKNRAKALSATKKATFKKKPAEMNEEVVSNKNIADVDVKTNQMKQKVQAHEATGSSEQPKKRFSFKLGGSLRQPSTQQQSSQCEPSDKNGQDKQKETIVPFLQLGSLVPYSDRKSMLASKVPTLSVILQKKRRHSSDRSDKLRDENFACELTPLNKAPKIDTTDSVEVLTSEPDFEYEPAVEHEIETEEATREVEEEEEDDTLIPDTNNLHHQTESTEEEEKETLIPDDELPQGKATTSFEPYINSDSEDLFAVSNSPMPSNDMFASQNSDKDSVDKSSTKERTLVDVEPTFVYDSDEDLFASTPQKSPTKKTWRQKRVSAPAEESITGRDGAETEIDSVPSSSFLQIPSNERDEMVLVCSGLKTANDRLMYKNFIKKFGLKEKNAIDKNVTHLVVSVNPQNCADRTLKFLQAITKKCWIISLTWVQECLTQNTLFIPESFEVLDTNNQPGPNRSRLSSSKTARLFDGFEMCLNGSFSCIAKEDLVSLLKDEGSQMARSVNSMSFKKKGIVIVDTKENPIAIKEAEKNWKAFQLVTVTKHWAMDSLSSFAIKTVLEDLVYQIPAQEIIKLGYN